MVKIYLHIFDKSNITISSLGEKNQASTHPRPHTHNRLKMGGGNTYLKSATALMIASRLCFEISTRTFASVDTRRTNTSPGNLVPLAMAGVGVGVPLLCRKLALSVNLNREG